MHVVGGIFGCLSDIDIDCAYYASGRWNDLRIFLISPVNMPAGPVASAFIGGVRHRKTGNLNRILHYGAFLDARADCPCT